MYESILRYGNSKYLWWSLALLTGCTVVYLTQDAATPPSGSTWQGYTLGTIGALLIAWLSVLGIRKRNYGTKDNLEAWVSAHVYLGTVLLVIALLHSAGQMGWNIHTAALVLMFIVIFSGFYGMYAYMTLPRLAADNRKGLSPSAMFGELSDIDAACLQQAKSCGPKTELAIRSSIEKTALGGGLMDQLLARDGSVFVNALDESADSAPESNSNQEAVLTFLANAAPNARNEAEAEAISRLVPLIARRQALLGRMRKEIQSRGLLKVWLFIHVPVTIALLVALLIHIVVVFFYW